uniref:Uncharacterized protein n=1 Tax=viral metagenome TaxID=1070528 RepID=A0A6C0II94_9ZZZZ
MGNLCSGINHNNIVINIEDEKIIKHKKDIITAFEKNLCLCFQINDGRKYIGKPQIYNNLQDINYVYIILYRDIPLWYHVGEEKKQIYIRGIENIITMNESEIEDSSKYTNRAPLFVQRLFPDN